MNRYRIGILLAMVVLAVWAMPVSAGSGKVAKVTYVDGSVMVGWSTTGPWKRLRLSDSVRVGQTLKTAAKSTVELTLPDQSVLRVAPDSMIRVDSASFERNKRKGFSASLILGKVWAKISTFIRGRQPDFKMKTATAVVGVRGTVYNLITSETEGTEVSVFSGTVGVAPAKMTAGGPKKEMAFPDEVTEQEWEEILLGRLQRLKIGPDGRPGRPSAFDPKAEADPWTQWNLERDARLSASK